MDILEALADQPKGLSVSDLSARCVQNKGSIARVLATLQMSGHVAQDVETERYHLSLKMISIANRHMDLLGFPRLIQPILDELSRTSGELAQLAAAHADRLYVIAKAEGDKRIRVESLLGREIALHASATGKAWLAALPRERMLGIISRSERVALMPNTITDFDGIESEIAQARNKGYAVQREELMEHMCAIAVPVFRAAAPVPVGSLAIAAPTFRFPPSRAVELHSPLKEAAARIGSVWPMENVRISELAVGHHPPSLVG
jgi:IclR family acetate operon transcriptional repressor